MKWRAVAQLKIKQNENHFIENHVTEQKQLQNISGNTACELEILQQSWSSITKLQDTSCKMTKKLGSRRAWQR